ncbi:hypothetical protein [Streptomyces sp. T028]|uniref:hypothetical protein n=1 Tax=Streptomyces sp. T028 TaxID=3394379 RepID=UPI003A879FB5
MASSAWGKRRGPAQQLLPERATRGRDLLDQQRRDPYAAAFLAKSQRLYGLRGATLASYDGELARTWAAYRVDHDDLRFIGEYRRELLRRLHA